MMLTMLIDFPRKKNEFRLQKIVLNLFFFKRIVFIGCTFFLADGLMQSIVVILVNWISMVVFTHYKPLGSVKSNRMGMLNEFLILIAVCLTIFFPGMQDEGMKY
jgi:hypothetical protein